MKKSHVAVDVSKMVAFGTASLVRTLAQMSRTGGAQLMLLLSLRKK